MKAEKLFFLHFLFKGNYLCLLNVAQNICKISFIKSIQFKSTAFDIKAETWIQWNPIALLKWKIFAHIVIHLPLSSRVLILLSLAWQQNENSWKVSLLFEHQSKPNIKLYHKHLTHVSQIFTACNEVGAR